MKNIMVMNLGSTSFKCKLFDMDSTTPLLAQGSVDAIGSGSSRLKMKVGQEKAEATIDCSTHQQAFEQCMERLKECGVLESTAQLDAVGYKAVLAGNISGVQVVTSELTARMEAFVPLAPAHNPPYIRMMSDMAQSNPALKQYACFETAFHATIPLKRAVYGVPKEWLDWGVRRYGFHGASHSYIAWKVHELLPDAQRVISVHLGGSCSACAILDGKSIASTMGATPQSGLFHNNRVGDFDPFCLPLIAQHLGGVDKAMDALSTKSGFLGLSGISNDMRKVEDAAATGDQDARLSIEAFCDEITGYIGMFTAYLGGLDVITFTGGIGEHSPLIRNKSLETLGYLGVKLDAIANESNAQVISSTDSRVKVLVLETDEELMIARQVAQCM